MTSICKKNTSVQTLQLPRNIECFEDNVREGKDVKNLGNILNEGSLALANTFSTICSHTDNNPYRLSVYVQEQQNSGSLRPVCFGFFNVSRKKLLLMFFFSYKLGIHLQVNKTKLKKSSFLEHHHNICIEKKKKLKRFISLVGTAVVFRAECFRFDSLSGPILND